MRFDMTKPCADCPFRKEGGIRLRPGRIRELSEAMLSSQGATFSCHKSVRYTDDDEGQDAEHYPKADEQHCAGALIYSEKHETATQAVRIAERLGMYDRRKLNRDGFPEVWDSLRQWLKSGSLETTRK